MKDDYNRITCHNTKPLNRHLMVRTSVQELNAHGLMMYDTASQVWLLHKEVKTTAQDLPIAADLLPASLSAFTLRVLDQLFTWRTMYEKGDTCARFGLKLAREHQADVLAVFLHLSTAVASEDECFALCDVTDFCDTGLAMFPNPVYLAAVRMMVESASTHSRDDLHARAMSCLGNTLRRRDETHLAEPIFKAALKMRTRLLGEEHDATIGSMNDVANCLNARGKHVDAEPIFLQVLALRLRLQGEDAPFTSGAMHNLGICIQDQGRSKEAELIYRDALNLRTKLLPIDHQDAIRTMSLLAICLKSQARFAEAEPLLRKVCNVRLALLGPNHPDTKRSKHSLKACLDSMT